MRQVIAQVHFWVSCRVLGKTLVDMVSIEWLECFKTLFFQELSSVTIVVGWTIRIQQLENSGFGMPKEGGCKTKQTLRIRDQFTD